MWEEEEEQIRECGGLDSVWEKLRNQPIYSPPPSPSSGKVFLICPQFFFSQPPPLAPQLHFSPPPTTAVLMSPYLDFSPPPPPPPIFLRKQYLVIVDIVPWRLVYEQLLFPRYISETISFDWLIKFCDRFIVSNIKKIPSPPQRRRRRRRRQMQLQLERWKLKCERVQVPDRRTSLCLTIESEELDDFKEITLTSALESIPLRLFLPPKSPKMVSIWSWLSVVKISRKISIRLLQVLPSVQLPQTPHIVIVEEKMTQLLTCSGEFISQDCSLVEETSVEITVEVDATNNGAHGVKAYENFPIVSHSEKKNTRDKFKRNYKSISVLTLEDLQQHFGSKREDVAESFGVSVSTLKRICRQHGISRWPFQPERQKERLMEVISPSMRKKHDSSLRCIRTPLHARSSPQTIALLDEGEMVQLDSSKQQSLVAFDITNNSAHLVRASQSCSTISHSDETNSRETLKRKCTTKSVLSFEDLPQHFSCKLDDAAKALGVSVSTVKRICRKHGIPRWPSQKKRKVSKTDCILLKLQGEKDVSPICSKMPADGQTERGNEMVAHLQDQNEGPNLLNIENGSNKESITTLISEDSVPVSEMDCILFEPEGEKNVSPTYKTTTVGIDFIEGPNLSNTENHSNEESITTPTFPDSVPGNYPAMNLSISSTYGESAEAGAFSELTFQPKESTPLKRIPHYT